MVRMQGLEPWFSGPKPDVLPLYYTLGFCGPDGFRTRDPRIKSPVLYLLSYKAIFRP